MNHVIMTGRIAADIEVKATGNGISVCTFNLAVRRRFPDRGGEYLTDFFRCVAWRNNAEFLRKHGYKGQKIAVVGNLQNRSYDAEDGTKRYLTEIVCDNIELLEWKDENGGRAQGQQEGTGGGNAQNQQASAGGGNAGYMQPNFTQVEDDELPF